MDKEKAKILRNSMEKMAGIVGGDALLDLVREAFEKNERREFLREQLAKLPTMPNDTIHLWEIEAAALGIPQEEIDAFRKKDIAYFVERVKAFEDMVNKNIEYGAPSMLHEMRHARDTRAGAH